MTFCNKLSAVVVELAVVEIILAVGTLFTGYHHFREVVVVELLKLENFWAVDQDKKWAL